MLDDAMTPARFDGPAVRIQVHAARSSARESLSSVAYDLLRGDIIAGLLRPNERIIEAEQSARLGMSRTPIRDALMRLESEGLVDTGRRGWTVHEFSRKELRDIYETRVALEGEAARLACARISAQQLRELEIVLGEEERDLSTNQAATVEINASFHELVIAACGNRRLIRQIELNRDFYFNQRVSPLYSGQELHSSFADHYKLLGALRGGLAEEAGEIVRKHLMDSLEIICRVITH